MRKKSTRMTRTAATPTTGARRRGPLLSALLTVVLVVGATLAAGPAAISAQYTRISGNGSSWAGNAVSDWQANIKAQGVTVDYTPDGSSSGRKNFAIGLSDYAVSEIPYKGDTSDPQDNNFPNFTYGMMPAVAGGTSFMYNLKVNGQRYTQLKLTQQALAKIFSGQVTQWNDPIIAATNPNVNLPNQRITVVVRSDGSGATAQFTLWMLRQFPKDWAALCAKTGCNANAATSYFPYQGLSNFTAQSQSNGVTTYTANTQYTINYDEYSYALGVNFPVAQVQNAAGFYTVPTDTAVAVALTQAKINTDQSSANYLSQDLSNVYGYKDPRTYPISAYSYFIIPTQTHGNFNEAKGATLGYFTSYSLCQGQQSMGALGYSPLPMNLVLAALDQVLKIPGVDSDTKTLISNTKSGVSSGSANPCNNPTFKPGDSPSHNVLIDSAPFPDGCDSTCQAPWLNKTTTSGPGTNSSKGKTKKSKSSNTPTTNSDTNTDSGGSGSGSGTGTSPSGTGSSSDASSGAVCDADTGQCVAGAGDGTGQDSVTPAGSQIIAQPLSIDGQVAWGPQQLATLIAVLMAVLLVVIPPLAFRLVRSGRPETAAGSARPDRAGGPPRDDADGSTAARRPDEHRGGE